MKKLLLVILVVALASFLFVGCLPVTPAEGEAEGEGEGEAEICPTIAVTSQVAVGGKTYIKGGEQTITVTFAVPTEPVSVYVGGSLKIPIQNNNPEGVPDNAIEVVMYPDEEKKIYTGTFNFKQFNGQVATLDAKPAQMAWFCAEDYIYVSTCNSCAPCKYPYTVDTVGPASQIKIGSAACVCEGVTLTFDTPAQTVTCDTPVCCGDDCSGFASYAIDLYTSDPFNTCCDISCVTPAYSCPGGVACPIDCTLTCITGGTGIVTARQKTGNKTYWVVATLLDNVGNRTRYYAKVVLDTDSIVSVTEFPANLQSGLCTDFTNDGVDVTLAHATTGALYGNIGLCK